MARMRRHGPRSTRPFLLATALALALACAAPLAEASAQASTQRRGYVTRNGVYVPPSQQTKPDGTKANNWSTRGNVNPYTGRPGTVDPSKPAAPRRR
jgi:hypothetical protein